jgi:RHS repeat-associated protein
VGRWAAGFVALAMLATPALAANGVVTNSGAAPASTTGGGGTGGGTSFSTTYFEGGTQVLPGEVVKALGPDLMGDQINVASGSLEFHHTDTSLPGNNMLPVAVGRMMQTGQTQPSLDGGLFGDWELEIPHLHTVTGKYALNDLGPPDWYGFDGTNYNESRCSQLSAPPDIPGTQFVNTPTVVAPNLWWDGYRLYAPGSGEQTLLNRSGYDAIHAGNFPADTVQPTDGNTYPVLTKANWQFSCLPKMANTTGEAFLGHAPDGSTYQFDHMVSRPYANYGADTIVIGILAYRAEIWVLPSKITDRFGNTVTYTYDTSDPWKVLSIQSSDGRLITLTYFAGSRRVQSVFDGTRTWSYGYNSSGALQSVTLPDASTWQFALQPLEHAPFYNPDASCNTLLLTSLPDPNTYQGVMTHPSGATATFVTKFGWHGRTNVFGSSAGCPSGMYTVNGVIYRNQIPTFNGAYTLQSKTLAGPGMSAMTWSYVYGTGSSLALPVGCFQAPTNCGTPETVQITDPVGNVTQNVYGTQFGINEGLLVQSSEGYSSSGSLRVTNYSYACPSTATYPFPCTGPGLYPVNVGYVAPINDSMGSIFTPQSQRTISQQGVTFTQTVSGFDTYARATGVTRVSSLGYSRTESTSYSDQTALWVLGQVASQTIAGIQAASTSFNASTALPTATYKFGKLQASFSFNGDGTLASVADGLNHTTSFSSYMRGVPQLIGYADGTSISGVVSNLGELTSVTNEAGTTWSFSYDAMGRLASKTPPGGDPVAYNPTTLSFVQVPTAEYGLDPNHWRQTITTGNAVTVNYFDARWRKLLTNTYDAGNVGGTQRMQVFSYDPYNRTTFAAYPARAIGSISSSTPGATTAYDALGRPTQTLAASELGTLTTSVQYLGGFQKQVTDPRGNVTTTAYQAFDEPSESALVAASAPEGLSVAISRDVFGKPMAVTRGGSYAGAGVSATRSYVYDANQLLCKTIEPEVGATIQSLDPANNVSWRAIGLALTGTTTCDTASVPATKIIGYTYDLRNRLTGTGFSDGSPSIGRAYTADGLPAAVTTSDGSTWTYGYNNRRLISREQLQVPGGSSWWWVMFPSYDANGNVSAWTYPDTTAVSYSPDALGEPTQITGIASGVTYQPNGAVAGYTLANGIVHTQTQNTRGLPQQNIYAGVVQDQYTYDANGNVASIVDQQQGVTTRSMGYDGLDRLTTANAPGVWGNATYSYDELDRLRASVVGSRNSSFGYDGTNKLVLVNTNGAYSGYAYDGQGNVTGRGTQGFYFDQGNRLTLANGVAGYSYDGLGRRIVANGNDGSLGYQGYSQDGRLIISQLQPPGVQAAYTLYYYLGGQAIAETNSATGTTYLLTDTLGSPVASVGAIAATLGYSCPSGWSLSGNTCSESTSSTIAATVAGYNCPSGYTLSGSTCSQTSASTTAATPTYSCPAGWSLSGTTCSTSSSVPATPVYACPSGYTLSGTSCSGIQTTAATAGWSCNGHGTLQSYAGSSSGYECMTNVVVAKLYPNPTPSCNADAAAVGLPLVAIVTGSGIFTCVMGPLKVYSCPSGGTLSGSSCTTQVTQAASIASYTCASGTLSASSCVSSSSSAATVSYSCPAGQTLSGTSCILSSTATTPGTPYYSCPSGYTLSGTSCTSQGTSTIAATAGYSCPSGGTLSGTSCLGVVSRTRYEPYGNTAAGTVPNGLGFTGQFNDPSTGLIYMQQRYYDPIAGRFLSMDPISSDADTGDKFDRYAYANNNPYRFTDPDGRDTVTVELPRVTITAPRAVPLFFLRVATPVLSTARAVTPWSLLFVPSSLGSAPCEAPGAGHCEGLVYAKPPADAKDPNGAKAPGKPGEAEGFKDPKSGEDWVKNPNGRGNGWRDADGDVWVPTGQGGEAHGGPHWDVQTPGGGYVRVGKS